MASTLARFQEALAWQQRGDLAQAEAVCEGLLREQPAFADAWHLRGLLAFQNAQFERGIECIQKSLALNQRQPAALGNIGSALLMLRRPAEALERFDEALRMQAGSAAIFFGRGNALLDLGRSAEALLELDQALCLQPNLAAALSSRGKALHRLQRLDEALTCLDRALSLSPGDFDALFNRGNVLFDLKRHEEALASYDLGLVQQPGHIELLNNRGNVLRELSRYEEAHSSYDRALALKPDLPETISNRGNALLDFNKLGEALACYEAALRIQPDFANALDNQGLGLLLADRPAEAVRSYARLIEIAPGYKSAHSNLLFARSMCCDWSDYERDRAAVIELVIVGKVVQPFPFLSVSQSPALQLECASRFAEDKWGMMQVPQRTGVSHRHERLRVAYVSADLRQHAVAHLMAGVFEQHDRERIETIAIALQPGDPSAFGQRIKNAFGKFFDVTRKSDREVAQLLRDLEVDIAVDLMGFTRWSRPGIFMHRAAPVQVNYLGYAGTLGSPAIDYVLADEVVIPPGEEKWFTEQVVRLPHSYLPNDDRREIAPATTRSLAGLPDSGFVFCAFTAAYKINPPMFGIWMRLLAQAPGSVLWLRTMGPEARANLRREAERRGVSPERLIFAPHVANMGEHLARQSLADLYLDTLPYNAHSTACDALWAGVPVLTCAGQGLAARAAASALTAAGLTELITESAREYEDLALQLARHPDRLRDVRARLAQNRSAAPLFDTARFSRHLEAAYFTMHQRAMRGEAPAAFAAGASR
jgi:protein O-GlcNAc transferase